MKIALIHNFVLKTFHLNDVVARHCCKALSKFNYKYCCHYGVQEKVFEQPLLIKPYQFE